MVPKLIQFDNNNKPLSEMDTIVLEPKDANKQLVVIPWSDWLGASVTDEYLDEHKAKTVVHNAIMWTHSLAHGCNLVTDSPIATDKTDRPYPLSMQREGKGAITVVATTAIPKGHLAIPVFCRKEQSLVFHQEGVKSNRAGHELECTVKWEDTGRDGQPREVEKTIYCQPEKRMPPPERQYEGRGLRRSH